jgi:hypothetical protein
MMTDFADVEQFAREHATCGGLTPNAMSRPGREGYLLTITCACGAMLDRWVTADEASRPLPRPSQPAAAAAWPGRPAPPRPQRIEVTLHPAGRASRGRAVWLVLLLVVALGGATAAYLTGLSDQMPALPDQLPALPDQLRGLAGPRAAAPRAPAPPPPAAVTPPAPPVPAPPPVLETIVRSLRELHSSITPSVSLNDYASRVAATRADVERLVTSAPEPARAQVRDVLDVHRLAVGAWRARTVNDRDEWGRIGRDPDIDLCASVKRAADAASGPRSASRAQARGAAVAASLPQLWACAAEKVAALDRMPAGL